jgi:hypothetical protein
MYKFLFIRISFYAIVNVISLILKTEWEWKMASSEENCTLSNQIFRSFSNTNYWQIRFFTSDNILLLQIQFPCTARNHKLLL